MLGSDDFRRLALASKDAVEGAHMGHPDFRVSGRIFASLHRGWGMVKLTPEQQQEFVRRDPATFAPESGAWGRRGYTRVRLESVDEDTLGEAMTLARHNIARKAVARPPRSRRAARSRS